MLPAPFGRLTWLVAALCVIGGAYFVVRDLLVLQGGLVINDYVRLGRDFANVWHGGRLAIAGESQTLYDIDGYRSSLDAAMGLKGIYAYSYPPHSLFLAIPFSLLPYWAALLAWTVAGLALFVHAAAPYLKRAGLPWFLAALLPAGFVNIWAAHYGFLMSALALYGWRWLDERPRRAGAAFALMTIKPHLGLLVAPILLIRRDWIAAIAAVVGSLLLILLSALIFGWSLWPTYLIHTLVFHADLLQAPEMAFHTMMPTTTMTLLRIGVPKAVADMAQATTALLALWVVMRCAIKGVDAMDLGLIAGSAIFLVLPYAFIYDMPLHCLSALVFAARATGPSAPTQRAMLAFAFLWPFFQMPLSMMQLAFGPIMLIAALLIQARIACAASSSQAVPA